MQTTFSENSIIVVTAILLTIILTIVLTASLIIYRSEKIVYLRWLSKRVFFPRWVKGLIKREILHRYSFTHHEKLTHNLIHEIHRLYQLDKRIKTNIKPDFLCYKYTDTNLYYDFMFFLGLIQLKYMLTDYGLGGERIDENLRNFNSLMSNRYIKKAIKQEERNMVIAEIIGRYRLEMCPNKDLKNVFYEDFVWNPDIVNKHIDLIKSVLNDEDARLFLSRMQITKSSLFNQINLCTRLYMYQMAVVSRPWI